MVNELFGLADSHVTGSAIAQSYGDQPHEHIPDNQSSLK